MSSGARLVTLLGLALLAALGLYGARVHWVEEAGSAERDGYVAQAERVLAGEAPRDPFRPPLAPYAIAALTPLAGDAFTAARWLSNLSAAALALLAFGFGRRLAPGNRARAAGLWAFALVATNPNTWILGQHTTTDMPFAACAAAALLAGLAYLQRPSWSSALAAGLAFGAAAATRGNAVLLLPALLAAWWLGDRRAAGRSRLPGRAALIQLAAACALGALVLVPQWILRARVFGDPWHDENWKNLIWKLDGYPDWSQLAAIPDGGSFGEIARARPAAVARGAAAELVRFATDGASQLFGTAAHALAVLGGAALCWRRRRPETAWLLAAGGVFLGGVALVFFTWGRLLLVLLPAGAGILAAGAEELRSRSWAPRAPLFPDLVLAALVGALAVKTAAFRLPAFAARHPYADIVELRRLETALPRGAALAGTSPFLERYLTHPYVAIPDAFGDEVHDGAAYTARLVEALRRRRVAYLVVGAADLRDRPRALLLGEPAPGGLALVTRGPRLTVWRVLPRG